MSLSPYQRLTRLLPPLLRSRRTHSSCNCCSNSSIQIHNRGASKPSSGGSLLCSRGVCSTASLFSRFLLEPGESVDEKGDELSLPKGPTIITVPVRLQERLEKKQVRDSTRGAIRQRIAERSRIGDKSRCVINCRRPEFNHYVGQSYPSGQEIPLYTKSWHHRKAAAAEDWFFVKPVNKLSAFGFKEAGDVSFQELGVKEDLIQRLHQNNATRPTYIQQVTIPELLKGTHNLVTAETGCGKTLAYLVPLAQQILEQKWKRLKRGHNEPYGIILVPSHELAEQIYYVATKLTEGLGMNVKLLKKGHIGGRIRTPPSENIDLLISTVHVLKTLNSFGIYKKKSVIHIVLDEADTLLDDSFSSDVLELLQGMLFYESEGTQQRTQLSLVSATMPKYVESVLSEVIDPYSLNTIQTPNVHAVMSHVPQYFHRLKKSRKPEKLLEIVKEEEQKGVPVMIFCNKNTTCFWMANYLKSQNIEAVSLHSDTRPQVRRGLLDRYQNGEVNVLICTDLGSRGINTVRTQHVVNYEFPLHLADYIHRCGRTGRVGATGKCRVTNFISGRIECQVVQEIEKSVRKEVALTKVNANIKRILNSRYGMYQPIVGDDRESSAVSNYNDDLDELQRNVSD